MSLVIEVALGVALGIVIVALLPHIIGAAIWLIIAAVVLGVLAYLAWGFWQMPGLALFSAICIVPIVLTLISEHKHERHLRATRRD